ncbi:LysR family transcriptional regulator [Allosphingosinicella sp.]|jgi:DNA-binding transcriptional LysR family regulator|uniref:LysR family transcriptional regulator n=1 Tax=Allosphingosinicella sp. TaxID=2823234 RepID=UPI002EF00127
MFDWNDLRHFLAVARAGSTLAAAEILRVNQTTVARRIAALERDLGAKLFDRAQSGYRLTQLGEELLCAAERVETEAEGVARLVQQSSRRLKGTIRVTTNETIANVFLTPSLMDFAELYPDIRLEVVVDPRQLDLARGEADVALRAGADPGSGPIVVRKLRHLPWAVYCSRDYARRNGCPGEIAQLAEHTIVGSDGPLAVMAAPMWLEQAAGAARVIGRSNSLPNMMAAVKAGLGLAILPCALAEPDPELVRCIGPMDDVGAPLWLVTRSDNKDEPRIRAFTTFISARIIAMRHLFELRDPAEEALLDDSSLMI